MSKTKMTFISAHFKNTPCLSYFIKRTPILLVLKHISWRLLGIGVHFIKYYIHGVFLKCAEILPTRLWDTVKDLKQLKKIVAQKNMSFYFLTENFLNIFSEFYMKPVARG
jgi:hypothetical protein